VQFVAVTAVGQDRPGIVAEFSGVLYRFGCNLEESTMTRLRDEFAMLLLVRLPEGGALAALQSTLENTAGQWG
jgi:glycine cleavage system transcriptional repressor